MYDIKDIYENIKFIRQHLMKLRKDEMEDIDSLARHLSYISGELSFLEIQLVKLTNDKSLMYEYSRGKIDLEPKQ